ncbi:unnamed protein product [Symbiodinium sp. CCMP2592]|nr:unnamed protein product [Symbiodinium sp. CCMP2592]
MCRSCPGKLSCTEASSGGSKKLHAAPSKTVHCTNGRKGPLAFCPLIATVQQLSSFKVLEMSPAFETRAGRKEAYMKGKRSRLESMDGFGLEHHGPVAMLRSGRKSPQLAILLPMRGCSSKATATALQGALRQTWILVHGSPRAAVAMLVSAVL